jgi:16S rRNA (cytosine967-C5)-methyltransferase
VTTKENTRALVLEILMQVTNQQEYSHVAIRNVLKKYQYLDKKDRAFIQKVAKGTIERKILLDYMISQFSSVNIKKIRPVIKNILRMSVYQMMFLDYIPDAPILHEGVKLAERKGFKNLKGFVNGILRNMSRQKDKIAFPKKEEGVDAYLSILYSMPLWIVQEWLSAYGEEKTECILKGLIEQRPVTIRWNSKKGTMDNLTKRLVEEKVWVAPVKSFPYAFEIRKIDWVGGLSSFKEGLFTVQDVSSMLAVEATEAKKGMHVLDICAAPGGKAAFLSQLVGEEGRVIARDLGKHKIALMEERFQRLGLNNIQTMSQDALEKTKELEGWADVIIADVPCSGLGVAGRKPDIKYRITKEDQEKLSQLQREMIKTIYPYLKQGGTLIYSTCTIGKRENEDNVQWILENLPLKAVDFTHCLPEEYKDGTVQKGYIQLLPGIHPCDGFFIARFTRKS